MSPASNEVPFDGGTPFKAPPKPAAETSEEGTDEGMNYFQKLAETA